MMHTAELDMANSVAPSDVADFLTNAGENKARIDWDYKVGGKVLIRKDGKLRKGETKYQKDAWTITEVHTNGTIRIQRRHKSE